MDCVAVVAGAKAAACQDLLCVGQIEVLKNVPDNRENVWMVTPGGLVMSSAQWAAMADLFDRKWSVFVLLMLGKQTTRFKALQRALHGVSQKVLTATLRSLERDGYVRRTIYPAVPP